MQGRKGMHRILVGRPEGKRPLGKPKYRWVGGWMDEEISVKN
jgi:hypothetical protein